MTGLTAAAEQVVAARPELVWDLVADVNRVGGWSPECTRAARLTKPGRPQPGARFTGHNRFPDGFEYEVTCVVTKADRPRAFAWVVLDDISDPDRPSSSGRYRIDPLPGGGSASLTDPAPAYCGQPARRRRTGPLRSSPPGWTGCGPA